MIDMSNIHKLPTETDIEIVGDKVVQRIYRLDPAKRDTRLLAAYGIITLLSVVLLMLDLTSGWLIFLGGTALYRYLNPRLKIPSARGQILAEHAVEIKPYFEPIPVEQETDTITK